MSQLNLTPEEDAIVLSALRSKAASYLATYGVFDSELETLIDKVAGQLPIPVAVAVVAPEPVAAPELVIETPPDLVEPTEEEVEAHFAKKTKTK